MLVDRGDVVIRVRVFQPIVGSALDVAQRQLREEVEHLRNDSREPALVQILEKAPKRQFTRQRVVEELVDVRAEVPLVGGEALREVALHRVLEFLVRRIGLEHCHSGMSTESVDRVVCGAVVEKHTMADPERPVVLEERLNVQRAVAHDGDDKELVRRVVDVGGPIQVSHPAAQQVRAYTELHDAARGGTQRTRGIAAQIAELLPEDRREAAHPAIPECPGGSRGFVPEPTASQRTSSTSKSQVTTAPLPAGTSTPRPTTSISNADST